MLMSERKNVNEKIWIHEWVSMSKYEWVKEWISMSE